MLASRVIFENQNYVVCLTKAGLSVQNKRKGNGRLLPVDSPKFSEWVEAFETAIDNQESNALARAIYQT